MKHLRYLDISETRSLKTLPKSIGKLYNLQTLRAIQCDLEEFPKEVQSLINLRHLYFDWRIRFPLGMSRLTHLRTLPYFSVGKEKGSGIEELAGLNELNGELIIYNLEHVRDGDEAKKAKLEEKRNLRHLEFVWTEDDHISPITNDEEESTNNNEEDVLEGLRPHSKLESLKIKHFMGVKFPSWMMLRLLPLSYLKKILLHGCSMCDGVPPLGHLPNLRDVEIDGMANLKCIGPQFYGYDLAYDAAATSKEKVTLFPSLKTLKIESCKELIEWMEAPVVSQEKVEIFPCLEELFVWNCPKLRNAPCRFPSLKLLTIYYIHSSTPIENISSGLTTLTSLILNDIEEITCLPEGILKKNKNLTSLEIKNCIKLTCIAPDVLGCCPSLGSLVVSGCEKLRNLPDRLDTLPLQTLKINACRLKLIPITNGIVSLCKVEIKRCGLLSGLPSGLLDCSFLQELTTEMCHSLTSIPITQGLTYLHKLSIATCDGLSGPLSGLEYCASLQELYISECPKLTSIPTQGMSLSSLQVLRIGYCEDLTSFPALELCPSLRWLAVYWCRKLTSISISSSPTSNHLLQTTTGPELFTNASHSSFEDLSIEICINLQSIPALNSFPFLPKFTLGNCEKLQSLVSGIQMPVSVECLIIRGFRNLETLPSLHSRTSLRQLWISRCGKLKYLPTEIRCLTHLKDLRIGNYWEELDSFPDFQAPSQLESLDLYGWPKLKSLPQQVQHLSSLTLLEINSFDGVEALPEWLGNLTSLSTLRIMDCKNLKYLPSVKAMQGLTKLQSLWISQCPLLQDRCTRDSGPEWAKISHIPRIVGI